MMQLQKLLLTETVSKITKSNNLLVTVRLWLFSAAWIHLAIAAIVIIPIDMSGDSDPKIVVYCRLKWRLITAWFNLINLVVYFPVCIYCEWKEKQECYSVEHVKMLRRIRDVIFTSIVFPVIMTADILFWMLYHKDRSLIAPISLFKYLPTWGQHSLHTVSLVIVILDLILVPRQRPQSLIPRLTLNTVFGIIYYLTVYERYYHGDMVYQLLETMTGLDAVKLAILAYTTSLFFFTSQWLVTDYIWGKPTNELVEKKC